MCCALLLLRLRLLLLLVRLARGVGMAAVNRVAPARRFFMHEAGGAVGDLPRLLKGEVL